MARDQITGYRAGHTPGEGAASPSGCRVLVIDDEPEMINLIRLILERGRGDEVIGADGGRQGIAAAREALPDLILLDIMMPEMDGWEAYEQIQAISALAQTPILFIAAMSSKFVYPRAQEMGAAGYVQEPFAPQELYAARDAALDGESYYPPIGEEAGISKRRVSLLQRLIRLFRR